MAAGGTPDVVPGPRTGSCDSRVTVGPVGRRYGHGVNLRTFGIGVAVAAALVPACQPACQPAPPPVCTPPAGVPDTARQVVVVTSTGSTAAVDLLVDDGSGWACAATGMPGRVGRNGVRELSARRSGDGTTPGGIFGLGTMTDPDGRTFQFFGNGVDPGVPGAWRAVQPGDCWGATPGTADYNQLVSRSAATCNDPDEYLPSITTAYSAAALIDANMGPNRSGDAPGETPYAAAIFLHRTSVDGAGNSKPTSGCVSLAKDDLARVLTQLVPGQAYFVIR